MAGRGKWRRSGNEPRQRRRPKGPQNNAQQHAAASGGTVKNWIGILESGKRGDNQLFGKKTHIIDQFESYLLNLKNSNGATRPMPEITRFPIIYRKSIGIFMVNRQPLPTRVCQLQP